MKQIITISREFCSGGRSIGKEVAERLQYAYYDRELVNTVAARCGFSPEFIEESGEYASARNSLLFSIATASQYTPEAISMYDRLYIEQMRLIEELAEQGRCVIVGRCADFILRARKDTLHVFIRADKESRLKMVAERYGEKEKSPEKRLVERDKKRQVYYKNYTGRAWGQAQNYDLCLNSGVLGQSLCADLIIRAAKG